MGMLAGTYTDPPALAYANSVCNGEAPAIGYSTVYPLSMFFENFGGSADHIILLWIGCNDSLSHNNNSLKINFNFQRVIVCRRDYCMEK